MAEPLEPAVIWCSGGGIWADQLVGTLGTGIAAAAVSWIPPTRSLRMPETGGDW